MKNLARPRERATASDVGEKRAAYERGKRAIAETAQGPREYEDSLRALAERLGL